MAATNNVDELFTACAHVLTATEQAALAASRIKLVTGATGYPGLAYAAASDRQAVAGYWVSWTFAGAAPCLYIQCGTEAMLMSAATGTVYALNRDRLGTLPFTFRRVHPGTGAATPLTLVLQAELVRGNDDDGRVHLLVTECLWAARGACTALDRQTRMTMARALIDTEPFQQRVLIANALDPATNPASVLAADVRYKPHMTPLQERAVTMRGSVPRAFRDLTVAGMEYRDSTARHEPGIPSSFTMSL